VLGMQHVWQMRNAYKIVVGKPVWKSPLGRLRHGWKDNIRMDLREPLDSTIKILI